MSENRHIIKEEGKMKVPAVVFASPKLYSLISRDKTLEQLKNVASLPGIVEKALAMPDTHQGYGFPVGGVAAFDLETGIISPGGIGYDINCGVRLLKTNLKKSEVLEKRDEILEELYKKIPSGTGVGVKENKFTMKEIDSLLTSGSGYLIEKGFATEGDIEKTEDRGCIVGADSEKLSQRAKARGRNQLGTLGSGNHFLEIQFVDEIFDSKIARVFGLSKEQVVILIHTGSRGLGHQTASDYIHKMEKEFGFEDLPDRELACAPISSDTAKGYLSAMAAAANFAFANRQMITYQVRECFSKFFRDSKTEVLYDIAHNIAKFEPFEVEGEVRELCVHRKGATRSFGPGRQEIPEEYRKVGQPIFIPGSMGTSSYVLVGTKEAEKVSFASTAHGAGRVHSRTYAKNNFSLDEIKDSLKAEDVKIKAGSEKGILEEAPEAYKDVDEVVRVSHELGIGNLVAKLKPLGVIKG